MFVFIKELMVDAGACDRAPPPTLGASGHFPITLTETGEDSNGNPVSYFAQVMQQSQTSTPERRAKARPSRRRRADLTVLRQSPYFSSVLLTRGHEPAGKHYEWKARAEKHQDAGVVHVPSEDDAGREVEKLAKVV